MGRNPITCPQAYEAYEAYEAQFHAAYPESGTLRSLILALGRFALVDTGVTMGLPSHTLLGALIRETRIVAQALLAISDFRHAFSRTAGAWLQSP